MATELRSMRNAPIVLDNFEFSGKKIKGTVRVSNQGYEKRVFARISFDKWKTWSDVYGSWTSSDPETNSDIFSFSLELSFPNIIQTAELAVCCQQAGQEHWDNNESDNYVLEIAEPKRKEPSTEPDEDGLSDASSVNEAEGADSNNEVSEHPVIEIDVGIIVDAKGSESLAEEQSSDGNTTAMVADQDGEDLSTEPGDDKVSDSTNAEGEGADLDNVASENIVVDLEVEVVVDMEDGTSQLEKGPSDVNIVTQAIVLEGTTPPEESNASAEVPDVQSSNLSSVPSDDAEKRKHQNGNEGKSDGQIPVTAGETGSNVVNQSAKKNKKGKASLRKRLAGYLTPSKKNPV